MIRRFIKKFLYLFVGLFYQAKKGEAVVLMYHSISEKKHFSAVNPEDFARQMEFLKAMDYKVISIDRFFSELKAGDFAPKTVLISFDDGFKDNYENAFPVLKKFNLPASIFVSSSLLGKKLILQSGEESRYLDEKEIKEMVDSGLIRIGAHGHEHVKFTRLNEDQIADNLRTCKNIIQSVAGKEINHFAYPFGKNNDEIKKVVKNFFKLAFGVEKGRVGSDSDFFAIKRNSIDSAVSFYEFKAIVKYGKL
jgi:peptidoglycan/xylan/chitin deacetylase (PgdA/CDA1 family)